MMPSIRTEIVKQTYRYQSVQTIDKLSADVKNGTHFHNSKGNANDFNFNL